MEDFREVYSEIYPHRANWHPIGLQLNLSPNDLVNIGDECRTNDQRVGRMLCEWLRKRQTLRPTWQALIDALSHHTVGCEDGAEDLRKYLIKRAAEGSVVALADYSIQCLINTPWDNKKTWLIVRTFHKRIVFF